jgi:2-keto-myo-inositol isomerase
MKYYLNTETLRGFSLKEIAFAAMLAAFDGLELWTDEIDKDTPALLKDHNLEVVSVIGLKGWFELHGGLMNVRDQDIFDECERRIIKAASVGAKYIVAVPSRSDVPAYATWQEGIDNFWRITEIGKRYNVQIALEFVGGSKQVNTVAKAKSFLHGTSAAFLLDTYHFWRGDSKLADLEGLNVDLLHISDANPAIPRETHRDRDRLMPGDGIIDIRSIIAALNYDGPVALGVYNPVFWTGNPVQIATNGIMKAKRICGTKKV